MSAAERLAAALAAAGMVTVATVYAEEMADADPDLAQDIEDGAALRRLREVLPEGWTSALYHYEADDWSVVAYGPGTKVRREGRSLAAAADACRVALEVGR